MSLQIDFSVRRNRHALKAAHGLVHRAYRLLHGIGAESPSDNSFIREAIMCEKMGWVWHGERGGIDAKTPSGEECELKATLFKGKPVSWSTSRDISDTVLTRWRDAEYWLFGVFDVFEDLIVLYCVPRRKMEPILEKYGRDMAEKHGSNKRLANPHVSIKEIRPLADLVFLADGYEHPDAWATGRPVLKATRASPQLRHTDA